MFGMNLFYMCLFFTVFGKVFSEDVYQRMEKLEAFNTKLSSENENLKAHVIELDKTVETLKNAMCKYADIKDSDTVDCFENQITNNIPPADDQNLSDETLDVKRNQPQKRIEPSSYIAFNAYHSSDACYSDSQTLIFDTVTVNKGNAYSAFDGIFVAPVSGLYAFAWSVVSPHRQYFTAELTLNGNRIGVIVADSYYVEVTSHATGVVLVQVNEGDHVYVRKYYSDGGCTTQSFEHGRTTFAGFILQTSS